ncbi:site-specific integrase [Bifidobacterium sp. ESL0769]|uniref:tyrosine-type recombinase/integrase n=1 Tax=Bifidobacterium sp. ESL0769 TaxID=2983229 RepID=UPI0023F9B35F|nr:site-specific integrase [Bifidobacterium sp. ESL0769]WEV67270.1 site-specific integrase [Bifidobacterium sp. ESL0769]
MAKTNNANDFGWLRTYTVKDRMSGGVKRRYQASYLDPRDKVLRINAPSPFDYKADAYKWLASEHDLIGSGKWKPPVERAEDQRRRSVPFRDFAAKWFANNDSRFKARTRQTYHQLLDTRILPTFGRVPLSGITVDMVNEWYSSLAETPTARANAYALLRQILKTACEPPDPLLEFNPCRVRGGSSRISDERKIASPEQVRQIADAMPDRLRLAVLLAAWLSLRLGEVLALRRGDFVLRAKELHITHAVTYTAADGFVDAAPKTAAGKRVVAIPAFLVVEIRRHMRKYVDSGEDSLLFCTETGNFLHTSEIEKPFIAARKKVGCPWLRFHDLRHTGNSFAMQTGLATIADLQKRGGWSTPSMALHYAHSTEDRQRRIAAALDDLATGKAGKAKRSVSNEDLMSEMQRLLATITDLETENKRLAALLEAHGIDAAGR